LGKFALVSEPKGGGGEGMMRKRSTAAKEYTGQYQIPYAYHYNVQNPMPNHILTTNMHHATSPFSLPLSQVSLSLSLSRLLPKLKKTNCFQFK